jgi:phosphatidylserine/phosphatidylglycerophosphate/cardiolipin synthase-like enzyme
MAFRFDSFPRLLAIAAIGLFFLSGQAARAETLAATDSVPVFDRDYPRVVRQLFQGAKSTIEVQLYQARFYEEYADSNSNYFLRDLIDAAQRGVEVRVVVDTGSWNPGQKNDHNLNFVDRLTTAGVQVWEDSPEQVSHQKVITVDGNLTLVGSTNWTFYSTDRNHEAAILLEGPEVTGYFRGKFWRHVADGSPRSNAKAVSSDEASLLAVKAANTSGSLDLAQVAKALDLSPTGPAQIVAADDRNFYPTVRDAILSATQTITVVQRSIKTEVRAQGTDALPGQPASAINVLVDLLIGAARRGVDVTVVLDKTDGFEATDNDTTAKRLLAGGVKVKSEDPENQTHAKFLAVDQDTVIVGSTNWTRPAVENGNEASVLVRSEAVNKAFRDYIAKLTAKGEPYEVEAAASIWSEEPPKQ